MTKITNSNPAAKAPGEVIAGRLREARATRNMSQREVVEWSAECGYPIARPTYAKLELGGERARNIGVQECLALAFAFAMTPSTLLTPEPGDLLRVTPNEEWLYDAEEVWLWLTGEPFPNATAEPILPEHIRKRREEDETLRKAEEIRARRAQEGTQA